MEGKADKLVMMTIAERSSSYLFYGLYITHPTVPRLGLTNFLSLCEIDCLNDASHQISNWRPFYAAPSLLSSYFSDPAILALLWLSQHLEFHSQEFEICDPTIPTLKDLWFHYLSTSRSLIPLSAPLHLWPHNPFRFFLLLWWQYLNNLRSRIPLSQHFEISDPTISALWDLWSHYQHY